MSNIVKSCLVVNIQVGLWQGYKLDKQTTRKVTDDASASPDAARVNKHLIPKEALRDIVVASSAARAHFYDSTLPWKDNGDRLLPRAVSMQFIQDHSELARKFNEAVEDFLDGTKYATAMEQAEFRMGDLFNPNDYPTAQELRRKFYINLDIDGVAPGKDIRLQDSEELLQARVTKAMAGLWERLAVPLRHFAETMSQEDAIFRNATVLNLREIVEMIPDLNFAEDPALDKIRADIEEKLTAYDPEDLRKNKQIRSEVAGHAQEIIDQMSGFMLAMGNGVE